MSSEPPLASIYAINDDILLCIFTFNADMFADRQALRTTLIASHVCRQWRDSILGTPMLWAKLIDMDHISNRRTHEWRNELVRRSGAAPLWIRAESSGETGRRPPSAHDKYIVQFFFDLVRGNWYRIQKLVILCDYSRFSLARSVLSFPAPQLEHCEAPFRHGVERVNDGPPPLFSNHAPMLRILNLRGFRLDQHASWLWHLHHIALVRAYSVPNALAVLSAALNLQELEIVDVFSGNLTTSLPIVSLPSLSYLKCDGDSKPVQMLLDHVEIPRRCSLAIRIHPFSDRERITEAKPHLLPIVDMFIRHARCSMKLNVSNSIDLDYAREDRISFMCRAARPAECFLGMSIPLYGDSDANLLEIFLRKLTFLDLESVTKLKFTADRRLNPCFGPLLGRLPSVEIISLNLRTLSLLAHFHKKYTTETGVIFPVLKVIDISVYRYSLTRICFVNQIAGAFLLSRLREGYPITTFDMSNHFPLDAPPKLDALAEVSGLKVLYKLSEVEGIVEYTCGSDDPERRINTI
ncbi:hypothetical protein HYPSUDRAFT_38465 [Hypholoma sublateritium FD-334 SS-4]|uniref:Uncharacterized protein n=1 Tax=Hypholoma sublateritium (strain FD-334 SS-4) TaxID=945553 RepID=A0A0D2MLR4_HYPSF|nr:hypothetical protein HYPSUDRAFT_38465 [Hypholoma sublateritium FD-334 SS-4]